jgi:hypothetical protein
VTAGGYLAAASNYHRRLQAPTRVRCSAPARLTCESDGSLVPLVCALIFPITVPRRAFVAPYVASYRVVGHRARATRRNSGSVYRWPRSTGERLRTTTLRAAYRAGESIKILQPQESAATCFNRMNGTRRVGSPVVFVRSLCDAQNPLLLWTDVVLPKGAGRSGAVPSICRHRSFRESGFRLPLARS